MLAEGMSKGEPSCWVAPPDVSHLFTKQPFTRARKPRPSLVLSLLRAGIFQFIQELRTYYGLEVG